MSLVRARNQLSLESVDAWLGNVQDRDANFQTLKALLIRHVLINGKQDVEFAICPLKELAILDALPLQVANMSDLVTT